MLVVQQVWHGYNDHQGTTAHSIFQIVFFEALNVTNWSVFWNQVTYRLKGAKKVDQILYSSLATVILQVLASKLLFAVFMPGNSLI